MHVFLLVCCKYAAICSKPLSFAESTIFFLFSHAKIPPYTNFHRLINFCSGILLIPPTTLFFAFETILKTNWKILPTLYIGPWAAVYLDVSSWTKMDHLIGFSLLGYPKSDRYLCNLKNPLGAKSYLL